MRRDVLRALQMEAVATPQRHLPRPGQDREHGVALELRNHLMPRGGDDAV